MRSRPPVAARRLHRHRVLRLLAVAFLLPADATVVALAQSSATTGTIQGRILSPATQEYLRNVEVTIAGTNVAAYSGDDGFYMLANVPAGDHELSVSYTGYETVTARVNLGADTTATRDFELKLSTFQPAGAAAAVKDSAVVTLGQFVVSSEREGNAKAIMDQRAALNMKNVIASDNFGDITGGNIASLNLPFPDSNAMYSLFTAHPEQFTTDTVTNFTNAFTTPRSLKEQVDAGYLEANSRWNQLRFNLGARFEHTRTIGRTYDILPAATVRAAGYTAGTIPYTIYQYRNGARPSTYGGYDNVFLSGGVKYSLTRNLVFQFAGSQSIGRPDYNSLAGVIAVNEALQRVTLPNPNLKPETSDKFFASAQYYIEPAGTLTVSAYQLIVKNMGTISAPVTAEAGYADDPEYNGYSFFQSTNDSGTRKIKGVDVEYS